MSAEPYKYGPDPTPIFLIGQAQADIKTGAIVTITIDSKTGKAWVRNAEQDDIRRFYSQGEA